MPKFEVICKTCNEIVVIDTEDQFFAFNCRKCRGIYVFTTTKGKIEIEIIRNGRIVPQYLDWALEALNIDCKYPSEEIIKIAWKKQMELYHPDKVSHLGKEFSELANSKTKSINEAYDEMMKWNENEKCGKEKNNKYDKVYKERKVKEDNEKRYNQKYENTDLYYWICPKCMNKNSLNGNKCKECNYNRE